MTLLIVQSFTLGTIMHYRLVISLARFDICLFVTFPISYIFNTFQLSIFFAAKPDFREPKTDIAQQSF